MKRLAFKGLLRLFFLLLIYLQISSLLAQGEADNWVFNTNTVINFSSGQPVLSGNGGHTIYQPATISDPCGNLLFYMGLDSVFSYDHSPMTNGDLYGGIFFSTFAGGLIIPHPGNSDIFYLIYHSSTNNDSTFYAIIDLSLQGGKGEVTMKNQIFDGKFTPRFAGVQHANGTDIWVSLIGNPDDTIYSYLFTSTGVSFNPVKSYVGPILNNDFYNLFGGQMRFSPDGRYCAISLPQAEVIKLLKFDDNSGLFSSPIDFPVINPLADPISGTGKGPGGIEFSPDGNFLYYAIHNLSVPFANINDTLFQLDLSIWGQTFISSSKQAVGVTNGNYGIGRMQLSNNGKIYISRAAGTGVNWNSWLTIGGVNYPNSLGPACDFQNQLIVTNPGTSLFFNCVSFPHFLAHYLLPWEVEIGAVDTTGKPPCVGDTIPFALSYYKQIDSILWDFG